MQFKDSDNYIWVPLAAFAYDNTDDGVCQIYIQNLDQAPDGFEKPQMRVGTPVILGSLFL